MKMLVVGYVFCIIFAHSVTATKIYVHCFAENHCCIIRIPVINDDNKTTIKIFIPDNNNTYLLDRFSTKKNETTNVFVTYEILHDTQHAIYQCVNKLASFLSQHMNTYFLSRVNNMTIISHGIGSQIAGISSNEINGKYYKIIALNPNRFFFSNKNIDSRLDETDAQSVHVIHTFVHKNFLKTSSPYTRLLGIANVYFTEALLNDKKCDDICKNNNAVDYLYDSIFLNRTFNFVRCKLSNIFKNTCNVSKSYTFTQNLNLLKEKGAYAVYGKNYLYNMTNIKQHAKFDYCFIIIPTVILCFIVLVFLYTICIVLKLMYAKNENLSIYYVNWEFE